MNELQVLNPYNVTLKKKESKGGGVEIGGDDGISALTIVRK